jgi:AraC-like DNA-binding protein
MPKFITPLRTYQMHERADRLDFEIRFQGHRNELSEPHKHNYFQIQIGLEGNTSQSIGAAIRPFNVGNLSFVLPHRMHVIPHPVGSRYCIINFTKDFLWPELTFDMLDLDGIDFRSQPELAPFLYQEYLDFSLCGSDFDWLKTLLDDMMKYNNHRRLGSTALLKGMTRQIIGLTCLRFEQNLLELGLKQGGRKSRRDALQRVIRYIRDNLSSQITLTDAATAAFLSPNYLANLVKKETGQTFVELVTERRLLLAKELLLTSSAQIREISRQCGFNDEAYFTRRFRKFVGCSPRDFREEQILKLNC